MANKLALLDNLLSQAEKSASGLRKLNFVMARAIPFNLPHRIKVQHISNEKVEALLPYRKRNLNHLKGLHAAALMTVGEYCSGIWLMKKMGSNYRLIMKSIHVDYERQGKSSAIATYELSETEFKEMIEDPLGRDGVVLHTCVVNIRDDKGQTLAIANVEWQLKDWKHVKNPKK